MAAAQALAEHIRSNGGQAMVPVADERFKIYTQPKFYSNWSERHATYIAGLGTFSLNRAIITEKGIAGRFCSVITDIELTADEREYTGIYDNCSLCGKCQRACPVDSINENGKAHMPCKNFVDKIKAQHPPWYGCGKCQCGMPCESGIPPKNPKADYSVIKNIDNGK
jgi:epoxyqueuosine reductase QueG